LAADARQLFIGQQGFVSGADDAALVQYAVLVQRTTWQQMRGKHSWQT
jgi:hypothetical protein